MTLIERVEGRRRQSQLSSNQRAGAHSRRQIRNGLAHWLRVVWRGLVFLAGLTAALIAMLWAFTPAGLFPYLAGASVASAVWLTYILFLESSGFGHKRSGILAEEWTAGELRSLRKDGWRVINHVMLERSDVDHALVGPGGFFAVETKFRSDWSAARRDLDAIARSARASAQHVAPKMRVRRSQVIPVVAMWGPGAADEFPEAFEYEGVTFCPGWELRDSIRGRTSHLTIAEVESAFDHLEGYVETRDRGERKAAGLSPRTFDQVLNDAMIVAASWFASMLTIVTLARIPPLGVWAVVGGGSIAAVAFAARRRWADMVRTLRVTTAVITTSAGLATLYLVALLFELAT